MLHLVKSIFAIAAALATAASAAKVQTIGQFAPGTWFENLAPTPDGHILVTEIIVPRVWSFNVSTPGEPPALVYEYSGYESVLGITETYDPNVFAVSVGNITFKNGAIALEQGSFGLWMIDYRATPATSYKVADLPDSGLLNGFTYFPPANAVLAADSTNGVVWLVDLSTGQVQVAANDTLMKPCAAPIVLGVNGVKYKEEESALYFTNSYCQTLNKIALNPDGTGNGAAQTVANLGTNVDDFDIAKDGTFYITDVSHNRIISLASDGTNLQVVAGSLNSSAIAEPTAVRVGITEEHCEKGTLFVTTAGGFAAPINGTTVVGAQLVEIIQY